MSGNEPGEVAAGAGDDGLREAELSDAELSDAELSDDGLIGHRVNLLQPLGGYRAGSDAVFLAAAVTAGPGDRVLDLGAGVGAVGLCLARRCPGLEITGLELQPALATIARRNIARNDLSAAIVCLEGDLRQPPPALKQASFDHVLANPPFHDAARTRPPENKSRRTAHVEGETGLALWIDFALRRLRSGGTFSLIHRPDRLGQILGLLDERAGDLTVFPLWPGAGKAAGRVIVRARKGSQGPSRLLPGLLLHEASGDYSKAAKAILRDGRALDLA